MPVFDATALLHFLEPQAPAPIDPETNEPLTDAKARIDFLIDTLEDQGETIIIPTPALSEVLVHADAAGPEYLKILNNTRCFRVEPFDERAAVELAVMTRDARVCAGLQRLRETQGTDHRFSRAATRDIADSPLELRVPMHELAASLTHAVELDPDDE